MYVFIAFTQYISFIWVYRIVLMHSEGSDKDKTIFCGTR